MGIHATREARSATRKQTAWIGPTNGTASVSSGLSDATAFLFYDTLSSRM